MAQIPKSSQEDKDSNYSLGKLFEKLVKETKTSSPRKIKYQIINPKRKIQPQSERSTKNKGPSENHDKEQDQNNLCKLPVNQDDLQRSISQCGSQSSSVTSLFSRLTVTNDKIEYKVNIVGDKKYQILQKKQPLTNFKKVKVQPSQETPGSDKSQNKIQLEQITIEDFFTNQNSWNKLDTINQSDFDNQLTYMIYREILNSDKIIVDQKSHYEVKTKIISQSQKNPNSYFTVLLALQGYLKSVDPLVKVIFCQKSSIKTQVSLKLISTGFAFQKFRVSQRIKSKILFTTFEDLTISEKQYKEFESWYCKYFRKQYMKEKKVTQNIEIKSVSKLLKGDLCIQWDTYDVDFIKDNLEASKRIKITPYFQNFYLSIEDFDTKRGNMNFPTVQNSLYRRGNYLYFPPQNCSRYSIKVWDKFDSGDNQWLFMENSENEWCSAYFGLYNPKINNHEKYEAHSDISVQTSIEQLPSVLQIKKQLKDTASLNTKQVIGQGIICTPYMWNALQDVQQVEVNGQTYFLVFQCRLNPKKLKISQKEQYWFVNNFSDVRPYGIILVPSQVKKNYPPPGKRFSSVFSYIELKEYLQKKYPAAPGNPPK